MRYIGVHIGHDAGVVALNENGEIIFFGQCERYSRFKNHGFEIEPIGKAFPQMPTPDPEDIIVFVNNENYGENKWRDCINISTKDSGYDPQLVRFYEPLKADNFVSKSIGRKPDLAISHHLAHAFAAWCYRDTNDERLFLAYDGAGHDAEGVLRSHLVGYISGNSFRRIEKAIPIPTSVLLAGLLGYNSAGKAMGLAGYMPHEEFDNKMMMETLQLTVNERFEPVYPNVPMAKLTEEKKRIIASFYRWYTNRIWDAVKDNISMFSNGKGVVIGGGTTLALEINTKIHEMTGEIVFAPPTDDSGCALGAAAFAFFHKTGQWPTVQTASLNSLQDPLPEVGPQTIKGIAELLVQDKVVGLLRGLSEAGPRALGFRSLLALPNKNNLERVSWQIKQREKYRPLAPIVTVEQFEQLFKGPKGEYMQFKCECTETARKHTPAICHKDNSARPQVVYNHRDPWLHELLVEVGKETGYECLINTSLNVKNKPICNTYEDARREFRGKDVAFVSLPHKAWTMQPSKRRLVI